MYEVKLQKNKLRAIYTEKRRALEPAEKAALDHTLCERFLSLVTYRYCDLLLLYAPKKIEVDVLPIARAALAAGKTVAFPRCDSVPDAGAPGPAAHTMTFRAVRSLDQLEPGSYGLLEPPEELPAVRASACQAPVIVIPALVYDRMGYRLGYGGGYYDRYLADFPGRKVGLIYSAFLCDRLPRSRYDLSADILVTERGVTALKGS